MTEKHAQEIMQEIIENPGWLITPMPVQIDGIDYLRIPSIKVINSTQANIEELLNYNNTSAKHEDDKLDAFRYSVIYLKKLKRI